MDSFTDRARGAGPEVAASAAATTAGPPAPLGVRAPTAATAGHDHAHTTTAAAGTCDVVVDAPVTADPQLRTARRRTARVTRLAVRRAEARSARSPGGIERGVPAGSTAALATDAFTISAARAARSPRTASRMVDGGVLVPAAATTTSRTGRDEEHPTRRVGGIAAHDGGPRAAPTTRRGRAATGTTIRATGESAHATTQHLWARIAVDAGPVNALASDNDRQPLARHDRDRSGDVRAESSGAARTSE